MHFLQKAQLSEDEHRALFQWEEDPFRSLASGLTWRPTTHHVLIYEGDQPVSHVGLIRDTVRIGDQQIAVGGLGGVITVPAFQGQGAAQRAIEESIRMMHEDWHLNHWMLFCFPHRKSYYERLGWVARTDAVWISQPQGRVTIPASSMVMAANGHAWPEGEIEIDGLPW
jgi:predicted GNAT family N-acyltransferase